MIQIHSIAGRFVFDRQLGLFADRFDKMQHLFPLLRRERYEYFSNLFQSVHKPGVSLRRDHKKRQSMRHWQRPGDSRH